MSEQQIRPWETDRDKLNKLELVKLERDGLDIIDKIRKLAHQGYGAFSEEDLSFFKWAGIYEQRPKGNGLFMMRVRIPSGVLNKEQARALAAISRDYGRDLVDVTTRQAVQFHWLPTECLPDVFDRLEAVGLFSYQACGDVPRTIVGNPLAGIDPDELIDTRPIVRELEQHFLLNREYSNLPRKYKTSVSSNIYNTGHAEINDLAFTPASKEIEGEEVIGFHVWVGGGLSAKPYLAQQLDLFVRPEEVVKVASGVTTIFRDYGYREKRHHARLKFLVADWGAEKFLEKLIERIGPMPKKGTDRTVGWNAGYFTGVHKQKQPGLNYVGLLLPVGRISADDLDELARLAEQYGNGELRTCNSQNILIPNVPDEKLDGLLTEPLLDKLTPNPRTFIGHAVSCTGIEYCNLAIVETKARMLAIANWLDENVELDTPIRLHINGCPNSCGQQQIADIGLQGAKVKTEQGMIEAFDIHVGGSLGPDPAFNKRLKGRIPAERVAPVIAHLIEYYKANRQPDEKFHQFVRRVGHEVLQTQLDQILATTA
ncbi:nitrite/sulfite reductase [Brevibacillus humidisoli]|uniref:nitrite/sulfite reductase n=1 Tax=Brevibacillus humidisoli TaxID=2895522 RepID=UPI001E33E173|nr:nitrite/sulfite reductase [Brevibacillus humidisoli]UFJ39209.1 nitrite/sulfite reductase [Brevibacillus humidisoli]